MSVKVVPDCDIATLGSYYPAGEAVEMPDDMARQYLAAGRVELAETESAMKRPRRNAARPKPRTRTQ